MAQVTTVSEPGPIADLDWDWQSGEALRPRDVRTGDLVARWYDQGERVAFFRVRRVEKRRDGNRGTSYSITIEVPALLINKVAPTYRVFPTGWCRVYGRTAADRG